MIRQKRSSRSITTIPANPDSLSSDAVFAMHQSPDGTLWFGTQSGLNRFDPQTQKFRAYREKQGLPNDTVLGILEDDAGYLWITTNNGLAKFDPRTELFTIYTVGRRSAKQRVQLQRLFPQPRWDAVRRRGARLQSLPAGKRASPIRCRRPSP